MLNLGRLYDRYGDSLYHYLVFKLGSAQDAEDVLQEIFCRFARYSLRWKLVRDPRALAFRVARNEANRFLKRKIDRRSGETMIRREFESFAAATTTSENSCLASILSRLDALPSEQREVLFLKIFDGMTFKEIGSVCGIPIHTAASRYRYGIEKLRVSLEEHR